jgi:hypothetical protein
MKVAQQALFVYCQIRVLDLDLISTPPRSIRAVPPLRDDALGAEPTRVSKGRITVAVQVLGQADARTRLAQ